MHELLSFLVKNGKWFLFLLYASISCAFLFKNNPYQHHIYLTTANQAVASVYGVGNEVTSYFNLRQTNADLNERNAELQAEVLALKQSLTDAQELLQADSMVLPEPAKKFDFVVAHVVSNSVARPYNYITINKGAAEGISPEMGVIDQNGVVGIVNVVGDNYSRVISLLNRNLQLSCKIKGNESFGSLVWEGTDPEEALLRDLPRHTVFHKGDTVITSGYSSVFPEGLPVGIILEDGERNENFFSLKVKLFTNFSTLSNVQVVRNAHIGEIKGLEDSDPKPN